MLWWWNICWRWHSEHALTATKRLLAFATFLLQHERGVRSEASAAVLCADGPTIRDVTVVNADLCCQCQSYLWSAIPLWQPDADPVISSSTSLLLLLATRYYGWSQYGVQRSQFKTNNVARWLLVTKPENCYHGTPSESRHTCSASCCVASGIKESE
jgi:hypothetical protein